MTCDIALVRSTFGGCSATLVLQPDCGRGPEARALAGRGGGGDGAARAAALPPLLRCGAGDGPPRARGGGVRRHAALPLYRHKLRRPGPPPAVSQLDVHHRPCSRQHQLPIITHWGSLPD